MKTGFWLKGGNGKLAGATVYQQNGETVMREVVSPSNPKTEKQVLQRIVMHTVMQAYSKMKEICDHSFEGMKKGQECMSYFMKRNVQIEREAIARMQAEGVILENMYNFVPLGLKGFTPNQYQVSMGSLPQVNAVIDESGYMGYVRSIHTNTYQGVIDALGLRRGDQLTFIVLESPADAGWGQLQFNFCRVILDPTNTDFTSAPLSTPFLDENGRINKPSVRNEGNFRFSIDATPGEGLGFRHVLAATHCCAVIVSRQVGEDWLRSTAYMAYDGANEYSLGECMDLASRGVTTDIYTPNSIYLNNAGQGGGAAAAAGESSGSGSGSGSGSSSTYALTSASVAGQAMIIGTTANRQFAYGTTYPQNVNVVANAVNVPEGGYLAIKKNNAVIAQGNFVNGSVTIAVSLASAGGTYTLVLCDADNEETATGYSFTSSIQTNAQGDDEG